MRCLLIGVVFVGLAETCMAQIDPRLKDHNIIRGSITFLRTDHLPTGVFSSVEKLVFDSDGRFLHEILAPKRLDPNAKQMIFVRGTGWCYSDTDLGNSARIVFYKLRSWPHDDDPLFFLVNGPCLPLAAGLAKVRNLSSRQVGTDILWSGDLPDQTTLSATYPSSGAAVPREIVRTYHGRTWNVWQYSGATLARPNVYLPTKAILRRNGQNGPIGREFEIKSADFAHAPAETELSTQWFRRSAIIVDQRVDPMVEWDFESLKKANGGSETLTPNTLLTLSQERGFFLAGAAEAKRQGNSSAVRGKSSSANAFLIIAAVGFVSIFGFLRLKARRSRGAAK